MESWSGNLYKEWYNRVYHYWTKMMLLFHTIDISPAAERNATTITQIVISRKAENSVECKICGMQNIRQVKNSSSWQSRTIHIIPEKSTVSSISLLCIFLKTRWTSNSLYSLFAILLFPFESSKYWFTVVCTLILLNLLWCSATLISTVCFIVKGTGETWYSPTKTG